MEWCQWLEYLNASQCTVESSHTTASITVVSTCIATILNCSDTYQLPGSKVSAKLGSRPQVQDASSDKFTTFIGITRFSLFRALPPCHHSHTEDPHTTHDLRSCYNPKHHLHHNVIGFGTLT